MRLGLLLFFVVSPVWASAINLDTCERLLDRLDRSRDSYTIMGCATLYFYRPEFDEGALQFQKVIRLYKRYIQLEPQDVNGWTGLAFLQFSQWSHYIWEPEIFPLGQDKDREVHATLRRGMVENFQSYQMFDESGRQYWNMARYKPGYHQNALSSFKLALNVAKTHNRRVRTLLNIAHTYRFQEKVDEAVVFYEKVLELESDNEVAARFIKKLGDEPGPLLAELPVESR